jgi:hypothetical protein
LESRRGKIVSPSAQQLKELVKYGKIIMMRSQYAEGRLQGGRTS